MTAAANRHSRWELLSWCNFAVQEYAINDLLGGASLATMQTRILAIGEESLARGIKTIDCTTFACSNPSFDAGKEAIRVALNDWRRDGSPIDATTRTAVAVGTSSNVLRSGQAGHPYIGYLETADVTETARNSGVRVTALYGDTTHLNGTGHITVAAAIQSQLRTLIGL
jgi:hypothetical protein